MVKTTGLWTVCPLVSSTASLVTGSRPSSTFRFLVNVIVIIMIIKNVNIIVITTINILFILFQLGCYIGLTGYLWKDKSENGVRRILEEGVSLFV